MRDSWTHESCSQSDRENYKNYHAKEYGVWHYPHISFCCRCPRTCWRENAARLKLSTSRENQNIKFWKPGTSDFCRGARRGTKNTRQDGLIWASTPWAVLESANHLERSQLPLRRRNNNKWGLETLEKKTGKKTNVFDRFNWIGCLNWPWSFVFIGSGGLKLWRVQVQVQHARQNCNTLV